MLTKASPSYFVLKHLPLSVIESQFLWNRVASRMGLTGSETLLSLSCQHGWDSPHQELDIEKQTPALHVFQIQLHTCFKGRIRSRENLPESRYAGFHVQSSVISWTVSRVIVHGMGARTNQAHVPLQHIPELR